MGKEAEEVIFNHLHATAFQYTPLGRTSLASAANIRTITKAHIQNYIRTHHNAPRMERYEGFVTFSSSDFHIMFGRQASKDNS